MSRDWSVRLADVVEFSDRATAFVAGMSFEEFAADERTRFAVQYALLAVGEAAKSLPPEVRARAPHLDWRGVIGMRDRLAHGYAAIVVEVIWRTVTVSLPPLRHGAAELLGRTEDGGIA